MISFIKQEHIDGIRFITNTEYNSKTGINFIKKFDKILSKESSPL
jgi:hypothetical protein